MSKSTFLASGPFWLSTLERAVKTTAQAGVAFLGAGALGIIDVDWVQLGSIAGLAGVVSVLTSIASGAVTDGTPSLAVETIEDAGAPVVEAAALVGECKHPSVARSADGSFRCLACGLSGGPYA